MARNQPPKKISAGRLKKLLEIMAADTRLTDSIALSGSTFDDLTLTTPRVAETTTPSIPGDGEGGLIYTKSNGKLYFISNEIAETEITAGTITALNNATANEIVTIGATTTELDAEANLTFDGTTLTLTGDLSSNGAAVFNDAGADKDFRVETIDETHMIFVEGSSNRVSIGDSVDSPAATLEVTNHATAGAYNVPLIQLNSNDPDQIALDVNASNITADVIDIAADSVTTANVIDITADALTTGTALNIATAATNDNAGSLVKIAQTGNRNGSAASIGLDIDFNTTANANARAFRIDSEQTTGKVAEINGDAVTTGTVLDISADALTTGNILNITSDSSDTSSRTLVLIHNDNTAATGVQMVHLLNDALGGTSDPILLIESTADETGPVLELKNSNAAVTAEAILRFTRSDSSAEADDMDLGRIQFQGHDDSTGGYPGTTYASILAEASDVSNGDESGKIKFELMAGGTAGTAALKELFTLGGEDVANGTQCEVVVNEDSVDCDFRVETDGGTHALFVDAGNGGVAIGASSALPGLTVVNDYQTAAFEGILDAGGEYSGEVLKYSPGNDDTLTAGQLYFLHTDGSWDSTGARAVATGASQLLGVGLGGSSRTVGVLTRGFIRIPSTEILNLPGSGLCDGLPLYVSTTPGHFDFTAPSGNNDFVRIVGYAIDDATDVLVYFNPDHTWVKVTA